MEEQNVRLLFKLGGKTRARTGERGFKEKRKGRGVEFNSGGETAQTKLRGVTFKTTKMKAQAST